MNNLENVKLAKIFLVVLDDFYMNSGTQTLISTAKEDNICDTKLIAGELYNLTYKFGESNIAHFKGLYVRSINMKYGDTSIKNHIEFLVLGDKKIIEIPIKI